jgi:hypothetical protein
VNKALLTLACVVSHAKEKNMAKFIYVKRSAGRLLALAGIGLIAQAALAQAGGSTYPAGSNLPQRTAGEIAPKGDAPMSGSAASNSAAHSQKGAKGKKAVPTKRHKRARPATR